VLALAIAGGGSGLAACASNGTPGPATASVTSISLSIPAATPRSPQASPSSAEPSLSAGPAPTLVPTVPSAGTGTEVTLRGTVREGVEASCVLLADDNGTVLANLLGSDAPELTAGAKVEVTGSFLQGVMTTCQQGLPFQVTAVKAL
jgi:hypothetical protein